jgi:polysaccharide pyruvyl transferase WcaK-like protein
MEAAAADGAGKGPAKAVNVLLVGYNGANNTGAEARLIAVIEDVRAVLGPEAVITIPALNVKNLKRYVQETPATRIVHLPTIFWPTLWRLARRSDLVMLVEGSTYIDSYSSGLLKAYLWATRCAKNAHRKCVAYAVDAGVMSRQNRFEAVKEANRTDLIITRTQGAADLLRKIGVKAPIRVTADTALSFRPEAGAYDPSKDAWWATPNGVVGLAMVDFHRLPVVVKLWGPSRDCYKWPFYYTTSKGRAAASERLADGFVEQVDRLAGRDGCGVALICMDQMDEDLAYKVLGRARHPENVRVFSSRDYNASGMTAVLRSLRLLVTSRYHAAVLAMEAGTPTIAVGHDARLRELFNDMGLREELFLEHDREDLFIQLETKVERLLASPERVRRAVLDCHTTYMERVKLNRMLLRDFVDGRGVGA